MLGGRLGVAAIGRSLPGNTTCKHRIKAVDRFLGNQAIDLTSLWRSLLACACVHGNRLFLLLDWTDLDGQHEALVAAVAFAGRALPAAWTTSRKGIYTGGHGLRAPRSSLPHAVRPPLALHPVDGPLAFDQGPLASARQGDWPEDAGTSRRTHRAPGEGL
jgi:hypothetical protein